MPALTWEQQGAHPVGSFPGKGGHDVAANVHGRAHLAVAEQLHDHARVHVLAQQQRRGGVPAVVQPDVADAGGLQQAAAVFEHSLEAMMVTDAEGKLLGIITVDDVIDVIQRSKPLFDNATPSGNGIAALGTPAPDSQPATPPPPPSRGPRRC